MSDTPRSVRQRPASSTGSRRPSDYVPSEAAAGEEDPGASLDTPPDAPETLPSEDRAGDAETDPSAERPPRGGA